MTIVKYGLDEGETCNRHGCIGIIESQADHHNECSHLVCTRCDWHLGPDDELTEAAAIINEDGKMEGPLEAVVNFKIDINALKRSSEEYAKHIFKELLDSLIERKVQKAIDDAYGAQYSLKDALTDVIREKLDAKYPGVVDDKVDQLAERIKNFQFEWNRQEEKKDIQKKALGIVDDYIEKELAAAVKKQADWLEQYSRNYFAHNLFRAMGMMDKMIPLAGAEGAPKIDV
jgi:hypothetical protein